ncbi:MAG: sulfotransferase [Proteobacteria bacterium]|nr:sulfotransferase [Pseudomonadota bacterium]
MLSIQHRGGSSAWLTVPAVDPDRAWQPYSPSARARPNFEAFRRLAADGRYDEAFAELEIGNRIKDQSLDGRATIGRLAAASAGVRAAFTSTLLGQATRAGEVAAPIFIVGVPRSGSTLVEQILASHPDVQAVGETGDLSSIAGPTTLYGGAEPFDPQILAQRYFELARHRGWDGRRRLVDKSLTNHMHVGLIHLVFPKAVILHSVRSALDTCFSGYATLFGNDVLMAYAYNQVMLAERYRLYRELAAHWAFVLMGRVQDIRHEALVADPGGEIRRLVALCDLDWTPRCLDFHTFDRPIDTASAEQVRRPIFADGIGRWRPYERHLGPMIQALGPYAG